MCLTAIEFGDNGLPWKFPKRQRRKRRLAIGTGEFLERHSGSATSRRTPSVRTCDGVAKIAKRRTDGDSIRFTILAPDDLAPYIASKGSVALSGVSLTVNEVDGNRFGVNIIPHTADATTPEIVGRRPGQFEIDMLARYVARQLEVERIEMSDETENLVSISKRDVRRAREDLNFLFDRVGHRGGAERTDVYLGRR